MGIKKTTLILLTVCMVAFLAAVTVNAASSHGSHSYSSSSRTANTTDIVVGQAVGNVYSAGNGTGVSEAQAPGIAAGSVGNVYSAGTSSTGTATNSSGSTK